MQKTDQIAEALSGLVNEGEKFSIVVQGGKIQVNPISDKDALRTRNQELHGKLLAFEQKLVGTGFELWFFILAAIGACVFIQLNPLVDLGFDLSPLKVWWVYLSMFIIAFTLNTFRLNSGVKRRFAHFYPEIKKSIESAGVSEEELISLIANDSTLFNVRQRLMLK
jgi:hypothetical protein